MRKYLIFTLVVSSLITNAQSILRAEGCYNFGYHYNVFNSPSSYLNSGISLSQDSLVNTDIFNEGVGKFDFRKRYNNNTFRYKINGRVRRFIKLSNAHESVLGGSFILTHHLKKTNVSGELSAERNNKLGINVLGDELNKSFSYSKYSSEGNILINHDNLTSSKIQIIYLFRDYDEVQNEESLTHSEFSIGWKGKKEFLKLNKTKHILSLSLNYRNRNYKEWKNTQLLNPGYIDGTKNRFLTTGALTNYPLRIWRYYSSFISYEIPFGKKVRIKPFVGYKYRVDESLGDFTFSEVQPGFRTYIKFKNMKISSKLSYQIRNYTDRITEVKDLITYPYLNYNYLRFSLGVEKEISKKWTAVLDYNYVNRNSNTTSEAKRTRRSYNNFIASIGLKYNFRKSRKY